MNPIYQVIGISPRDNQKVISEGSGNESWLVLVSMAKGKESPAIIALLRRMLNDGGEIKGGILFV